MVIKFIYAKNIKCDGCVSNIKEQLEKREDVSLVEVEKETGKVTITGDGFDIEDIAIQLVLMGYPQGHQN